MRQFEYFTETKFFKTESMFKEQFEYLNDMGIDGWELCHKEAQPNNWHFFIFKREIRGNPVSQGTPQTAGIVSPYH